MKKIYAFFMILAMIILMCSCGKTKNDSVTDASSNTSGTSLKATQASKITVEYSEFDLDSSVPDNAEKINLNSNKISTSSNAVTVNGTTATIVKAGSYVVSGTLSSGQIKVAVGEKDKVQIILNGVTISNSNDSPIYVESADKVAITLCKNTTNVINDNGAAKEESTDETEEKEETRGSSAIFSESALTINGEGKLTVNAKYNNSIQSKKTLKIVSGIISVISQNNGLKGKNAVCIKDGEISVKSNGDGIETKEAEDTSQGYVYIGGGKIDVESESDGINASLSFVMTKGTLNIITTGKVTKSSSGNKMGKFGGFESEEQADEDDGISSKGIKAGADIYISGGTFEINTTDHSIHSANTAEVVGGTFNIASSAGKGITTHGDLNITGGTIEITNSSEGIESKKYMTIDGGEISIVASDDGINAGGQSDTGITINGGYIFVDSEGDGLDSNGDFVVNGGTVIVAGPTNSGNGAIDASEGICKMTGGTLIAYGSAGMVEYPDEESEQNVVSITLENEVEENELVAIVDSKGNAVTVFAAKKKMQNVVVCTPDIKNGDYTVYTGGSYTSGKQKNGVYSSGNYKNGTKSTTFTVSSIVTTVGSSGMNGMGGMGENRGERGERGEWGEGKGNYMPRTNE